MDLGLKLMSVEVSVCVFCISILTMPFRDTVEGDALSMLAGSKMTLHEGDMGMRSPLARVSVRLSSSTELRFSIQMASTGPSRTSQICSPGRGSWLG